MGRPEEPPEFEPLTPARALKLLWPFALAARKYDALIEGLPYDAAYEGDGDMAVVRMALGDDLSGISQQGWRVFHERITQVCTVFAAADLKGIKVMQSLPVGLTEAQQASTLLLRVLLGDGRKVDLRMLDQPLPEGILPFWPRPR